MSTEFTTSDVEVNIFDENILPRDASVEKVTIKWNLEFEMRSWGVKGVYAFVPDQKLTLLYTVWDEATDTDVEQEKVIDLTNVQVDMDNVQITQIIAPKTLEFYKGNVTVVF